MKIKLRWRR